MRISWFAPSDLGRILLPAVLACGFILQAQTPVSVDNPASPFSNNSSAGPALQQTSPSAPSAASSSWNQLLLDAFQLGTRSMHAQGGMGGGGLSSGSSFQPTGGGQGFGPAPQAGGGARPGATPDLGSLFQMASDLSRGLGAGRNSGLGTALGVLPKLNQWMHSGLNLNLTSSGFQFGAPGGPGAGGGPGGGMEPAGGRFSPPGSATASFDSPRGRTGRFDFSAAASVSGPGVFMGNSSAGMSSFGRGATGSGSSMFGGAGAGSFGGMQNGSMGGAQHGGGMGASGPGGGQKLPSASLSLHLSF